MAQELRIPILIDPTFDIRPVEAGFAVIESRFDDIASSADAAFADVKSSIGNALGELPMPTVDTNEATKSVSELALSFQQAQQAAVRSLAEQRQALAALIADGKQGSDQFVDLVASIIDTENQLDELSTAQKKVIDLFGEPIVVPVRLDALDQLNDLKVPPGIEDLATAFDHARAEAVGLLEQQQKASAALLVTGQKDSQQYKDLQVAIAETKTKVQELDEAAQQVGEGKEGILEQMFKFEAIQGVGEFLGGVAERGNGLRQELKNLTAQTRLFGVELQQVEDSAFEARIDGIGTSLAETTKIMGVAQQQLGKFLDAPGLDAFTTRAAGIGKVFNKDVTEVISKGRTFVAQFGESGEESGNLIALAMQGAGNALDDVLDTTDEYSQHVKQAGFDAQEFTGILIRGVQEGARDTDKLGDAIKETQIRLKAGDVSSALAGISSPITETIKGIVSAGEQGQISVKEVLQQSAASIETAFNAGEISESVRSQLQTAISGTPAEDIGSDLYARIFSAPIDSAEISRQAAVAGQQMVDAIRPTIVDQVGNFFSAAGEKVAAFVAPVASGVSQAVGLIGQLGPAATVLKDFNLLPVDKVKSFVDSLGGISGVTAKVKDFAGSIGGVSGLASKAGAGLQAAFTAATGPIGLTIAGIAALAAGLTYFFTQTEVGREAFDTILGYVGAFVSGAGDLLGALFDVAVAYLNPVNWFSGDDISEAKDKLGKVVDGILSDARGRVAASGIERAVEDAITLKGQAAEIEVKVKAAVDTQALIADFSKAQTQVEEIQKQLATAQQSGDTSAATTLAKDLETAQIKAAELSGKINEVAPSAVTGLQTITDSTGKLHTSFAINIDKASQLADAEKKVASDELLQKTDDYSQKLQSIASDYQTQRAELDKLSEAINKGVASPDQIKRFQELSGQVNVSRDAMVKAFQDGAKAGLVNDAAIKAMSKSLGISETDLRKMVAEQQKLAQETKKSGASVDDLSKSFSDFQKAADEGYQKATAAIAELIRQGKQGTEEFRQAEQQQRDFYQQRQQGNQLAQAADLDWQREQSKVRATTALERKTAQDRETAQQITDTRERQRRLLEIDRDYQIATIDLELRFDQLSAAERKDRRQKQDAERAKYQQDVLDLNLQFAQEDLDAVIASEEKKQRELIASSQRRLDLLKGHGARDRQTTEQLYDQQLELQRQKQRLELEQFVDSSQELEAKRKELLQQVATGTLTPELAATQLRDFRQQLLRQVPFELTFQFSDLVTISPLSAAFREQFAQQAADLSAIAHERLFALEESRIAEIVDQRTRERDLRILEARKTLDAELRAAGSNATAIAVANETFRRAEREARTQFEIDTEIDVAERARKQRLFEAQKTLDAELEFLQAAADRAKAERDRQVADADAAAQAGAISAEERTARINAADNRLASAEASVNAARAAANKQYRDTERAADTEFYDQKQQDLADSNVGLASALEIQKGLWTEFYDEISAERRKELIGQRDDLQLQEIALEESLKRQEITQREFDGRQTDLARQRAEIDTELAGSQQGFWASFAVASEKAFSRISESHSQQLRQIAHDTKIAILVTQDDGSKSWEITAEEVSKNIVEIGGQAATVVGATWGQMAASGKATLGDFADAAIITTIDTIRTTIEGNIIGIVAAAFAMNPFLGIASIGAVLVVEGLLAKWEADAKGRIGAHGFHDGGDTGRGPEWEVAGVVHYEEFVLPQRVMAIPENRAVVEHIYAGRPLTEFGVIGFDEPQWIVPQWAVTVDGKLVEHSQTLTTLTTQVTLTETILREIVTRSEPRMPDILGAMRHGQDLSVVYAQDAYVAELRAEREDRRRGLDVLDRIDRRLAQVAEVLGIDLPVIRRNTRDTAKGDPGLRKVEGLLKDLLSKVGGRAL